MRKRLSRHIEKNKFLSNYEKNKIDLHMVIENYEKIKTIKKLIMKNHSSSFAMRNITFKIDVFGYHHQL